MQWKMSNSSYGNWLFCYSLHSLWYVYGCSNIFHQYHVHNMLLFLLSYCDEAAAIAPVSQLNKYITIFWLCPPQKPIFWRIICYFCKVHLFLFQITPSFFRRILRLVLGVPPITFFATTFSSQKYSWWSSAIFANYIC